MNICHDLKKESESVSPPLPSAARVIPVIFYLAVAGCLFFVAYSFMQINEANKSKTSWLSKDVEEKKKIADLQAQTSALENDLKKASSMITWLRSAQPVQPLAAYITTSIQEGTTINELDLMRSADSPWQMNLTLKINNSDLNTNAGSQQIDETTSKLTNEGNYRLIPQGKQGTPEIAEYHALVLFPTKSYE